MPFRNDTTLVAFRYDQAAQAEPPVPIGPAKSTLRCQPSAAVAARTAATGAKAIVKLDVQPTSCIAAPAPATITTDADASSSSSSSSPTPAVPILARTRLPSAPVSGPATNSTPILTGIIPVPVVVAPPRPPPFGPLRALSGIEEHLRSAMRTTPRSSDPDDFEKKLDSSHAPGTTSILTSTSSSSRARTCYNERSEKEGEKGEDEDPFPREKTHSARRSKFVSALTFPPLRIRSASATSLYAQTHNELKRADDLDLGGANNDSASSIPLHSPGLSEVSTVKSTFLTTTPPNFPVEKISTASTVFLRPFFSFRTFKKKKQQQQRPLLESPAVARDEDLSTANHTLSLDEAEASSTAPVTGVATPRHRGE